MNNIKEYVLPPRELLNTKVDLEDKKYYSLSKLLLKKDINDKYIVPIGIDSQGKRYYVDLKNSKGMFIAGETGSGKSMLLNSIIATLLFKNSPQELQFLLINQTRVEFNQYNGIPHLLEKVTGGPYGAMEKLYQITKIMEDRREKLLSAKTNNIETFNEKNETKLSHIIIIIDETSDIMENEDAIKIFKTILKDGYYLGIHLILSTSSYLKNSFNQNFIESFDYILSLDLATKEQASFIKLKGADLLSVYGEAMVKTNENIDIVQTPYISSEETQKIVDFIINNN